MKERMNKVQGKEKKEGWMLERWKGVDPGVDPGVDTTMVVSVMIVRPPE